RSARSFWRRPTAAPAATTTSTTRYCRRTITSSRLSSPPCGRRMITCWFPRPNMLSISAGSPEPNKEIREQIALLEAPILKALYDESFDKYPYDIRQAITTPPEKRDTMQWLMYHKAQWQLNYGVDEDGNGVRAKLKGEAKKEYDD